MSVQLSGEDIRFLAQQPEGEVNMIMGQMTELAKNITSLQQDTDDKVAKIENQGWFKRMCNTVFGKNKATKQEIQKNNDKIITYISQSVSQLYNMNLINQNAICSLGNRMNEVYSQVTEMYQEQLNMKGQISEIMAIQQQTLESMGAFVSKLNEKIESVDNFHMLLSEIRNGMYNDSSVLYSLCLVLAQLDKRSMENSRKMALLNDTLRRSEIVNDNEVSIMKCLQEIINLPQDKVGLIYLELCNFRSSFPANLFADMIENYHFLTKMEKMSVRKDLLIQSVINFYNLDPQATFAVSDISESFLENKMNSFVDISNVQIESNSISNQNVPDNITNEEINNKLNEMYDNDAPDEVILEYVSPLAEKGFMSAQYALGGIYQYGFGVDEDHDTAFEWYMKAAEQGDGDACNEVAEYYYHFDDKHVAPNVKENAEKAEYWFRKAAELESEYCYAYASFLDELDRIEEAVEWYKKAADKGNLYANGILGVYYYNRGDYDIAYGYLAEHYDGDGEYLPALLSIGNALILGNGCNEDYELAEECCNRIINICNESSDENNIGCLAQAELMLGIMYRNIEEYTVAVECFESSISHDINNDYTGMLYYALGILYYEGKGVEQNISKAEELFKISAEQEYEDAVVFLNENFSNNSDNDIQSLMRSAKQGSAEAQYKLGMCYYNGNGVAHDNKIAIQWFKKAASKGNKEAIAKLKMLGVYK